MKTTRLYLLYFLLMAGSILSLNAQTGIPEEIINALKKGDAIQLSNYLNSNVELVILNNNNVYGKQQATAILSDFFKNNKVTSFTLARQQDKESASFAIGTMKTSTNSYRIYILTRKNENQTIIQQLRIELSDD